jgi:uncharacterized protein (DUF302 family)
MLLCALFPVAAVQAAEGMIAKPSNYPAKETMDRFESVMQDKGMRIFARIDHAAGAASIGSDLRPTELLIFGNPKGGTPLMQCAQSIGIDLPLKALVWQDASGQVWLGYNDPAYLARRHGIEDCGPVAKIAQMLQAAVAATLGKMASP